MNASREAAKKEAEQKEAEQKAKAKVKAPEIKEPEQPAEEQPLPENQTGATGDGEAEDNTDVMAADFDGLMPQMLNSDDNLKKIFEEMERRKGAQQYAEVTSNYLDLAEFQKGEERNYIYLGVDRMKVPDQETGEVKEIDCVKLVDKQRNQFICGSAVLVSACRKITKAMCPITIQVNGKAAGKKYYDVRVFMY